jgi:hypothetical protein
VELEILSLGEIPDDMCGVCVAEEGTVIAIARAGNAYGALFVCEGCAGVMKARMIKRAEGLPN